MAVVAMLASSAAACDVFIDRRSVASEVVTSANLRRLRSVLLEYREDCGGFPAKLQLLFEPAPECTGIRVAESLHRDTSESTSADLMSAAASRPVSGYSYAYSTDGSIAAASPLFGHFEILASPTEPGVNGKIAFWTSDASEVRPYRNGAPGLGHR